MRLCQDDARICQQPLAGSPWTVPLTVSVKSPINLTALKAIDGLGSWTTYQGNASHTGFVDASFNPAAFSRRWNMAGFNDNLGNYASTATEGGRVFFVRHDSLGTRWELLAVSEDTGALAWKVDLGPLSRVNPPAVSNGRVYVTSNAYQDAYMWVFDQATGAQLNRQQMISQWTEYSAPTVFGTDVYSFNGYLGGIAKYSDVDGKISWSNPAYGDDGWSPATDGRFIYSYTTPDNTLAAFNPADGSRAFAIGGTYVGRTRHSGSPVVLTGTQQAIVAERNLMAFDLATRTRSWVLDTGVYGAVAYGNGTIYVFDQTNTHLEARSPASGKLLWTTSKLESDGFDDINTSYTGVIVTRNLAFVSSAVRTLAIDLNTHTVVWSCPKGGNLAISPRGVLYILNKRGELTAVNLR